MLRVVQSSLALLLLVGVVAPPPAVHGAAREAAPAATPAALPRPPTQPATGPGGSEAPFGGVTAIEQTVPGLSLFDYLLFVPADPLLGTARAGEPFPLVIFLHGSGAFNADAYLAWIEHLVRRGAVVLFPLYQRTTVDEAENRQTLLDGVGRALETLEQRRAPRPRDSPCRRR